MTTGGLQKATTTSIRLNHPTTTQPCNGFQTVTPSMPFARWDDWAFSFQAGWRSSIGQLLGSLPCSLHPFATRCWILAGFACTPSLWPGNRVSLQSLTWGTGKGKWSQQQFMEDIATVSPKQECHHVENARNTETPDYKPYSSLWTEVTGLNASHLDIFPPCPMRLQRTNGQACSCWTDIFKCMRLNWILSWFRYGTNFHWYSHDYRRGTLTYLSGLTPRRIADTPLTLARTVRGSTRYGWWGTLITRCLSATPGNDDSS